MFTKDFVAKQDASWIAANLPRSSRQTRHSALLRSKRHGGFFTRLERIALTIFWRSGYGQGPIA